METLRQELEQIREMGLYRRLRRMESASSRYVTVEGRKMLMCASNNYLGLADDPRMIEAALEAIRLYGTGSSGSRLITGNSTLHEELEQRIARFKGTESAIVFNTGYMANIAALTALVGAEDVILSDELNHASIIDGCRLSRAATVVYRHADLEDLNARLAASVHCRRRIIVTDGVFSMDGDIAPLPEIVRLAEKYRAWVMVDDAHAAGVLGSKGTGTAEHFGLQGRVPIQMGTLSKAVGSEGGYIAGSRELIELLRNRARPFIFSTALSPGVAASALCGIRIIEEEAGRRIHLQRLAERVRTGLLAEGFHVLNGETPIIAVITGDAESAVAFSRELEQEGIFAPAIRPPTVPQGSSRIRLTLMATHTDEDADRIIDGFRTAGKGVGIL